MAAKTRLLKESFYRSLLEDIADEHNPDTELQGQYKSFQELLIKDITPEQFADLYAQTLAYGMFAARSKDPTLNDFDRREAAELIPKTNPFLRKLFQYIAGYDLDTRLSWIIDGLADVFRATDVAGILQNFGKRTRMEDPIIHFYEDFLKEYNPGLRVERGVWYTPQPVVQFIVRAVDEVLKNDFGISAGLADDSKIDITVDTDMTDNRTLSRKRKHTKKVHRVQILDPATGTGTFLSEVVRKIRERFDGMDGLWPTYVDHHLIPRLNGFEILMASYAMAHLKLDLLLQETGYTNVASKDEQTGASNQHFNIYLTNSLEPGIKEVPNLFMNQWLTTESVEASRIKTETPIMVVLGNPPYSGISANNGKYIMDLMDAYKKEPGGKQKLQERKHWLNDDYVKFLRLAQHLVEKNSEGVVAYINPHGFLDNPTFRGMRWHLLKTFDNIYTIDLHGNSNKKETAPDGSKDDNVFDIQQGVSINIFVKLKSKSKNELAQVYHYDLYGRRKDKYAFLEKHSLKDIAFTKVPNLAPDYFMVPKDFESLSTYENGLNIIKLFNKHTTGIVTAADAFIIDHDKNLLSNRLEELKNPNLDANTFKQKFKLGKNYSQWLFSNRDVINFNQIDIVPIIYRPFDIPFTAFHSKLLWRTREDVFKNFIHHENYGLLTARSNKTSTCDHFFITEHISECKSAERSTQSINAPLYIYSDKDRTPNLDRKMIQQFAAGLGLSFLPDHDVERLREAVSSREQGVDAYSGWPLPETKAEVEGLGAVEGPLGIFGYFTPLDVLDYIYAVLHSPSYRDKYKEFLKTDFPRVPWPDDVDSFWKLVHLGGELRQFHLMKHEDSEKCTVTYPAAGDNVVRNKMTKTSPGWMPYENSNLNANSKDETLGKVWINDQQYFDKVPLTAWEFYIGGYQPAQKWLKDRRDRELTIEDIQHYRKIIKALMETTRLMREVNEVLKF